MRQRHPARRRHRQHLHELASIHFVSVTHTSCGAPALSLANASVPVSSYRASTPSTRCRSERPAVIRQRSSSVSSRRFTESSNHRVVDSPNCRMSDSNPDSSGYRVTKSPNHRRTETPCHLGALSLGHLVTSPRSPPAPPRPRRTSRRLPCAALCRYVQSHTTPAARDACPAPPARRPSPYPQETCSHAS